jgi:hypothetical protein
VSSVAMDTQSMLLALNEMQRSLQRVNANLVEVQHQQNLVAQNIRRLCELLLVAFLIFAWMEWG